MAMVKNYAQMPVPSYKITKAALNMLTVQYALDFAEKGFTFVAVSPGVSDPGLIQARSPCILAIC